MDPLLQACFRTAESTIVEAERPSEEDVIRVNETASMAASAYEVFRNTLEYDEEHLLRRNAIRRFLKRRLGEGTLEELSSSLVRELIWAKYLPNKRIPERVIGEVAEVMRWYIPLLRDTHVSEQFTLEQRYEWLLDALAAHLEVTIVPTPFDDALLNFAYATLRTRLQWSTEFVKEDERELQLFIATTRTVLKSDDAMLRFRLFRLYEPSWGVGEAQMSEIEGVMARLPERFATIEKQMRHASQDALFRLIRRYTFAFHVLRDLLLDHPEALSQAIEAGDTKKIHQAVEKAAHARYTKFKKRLRRSVLRAVLFLLCTKTVMALLLELPYERFVLQITDWKPILVNIFFHPLLLGVLGLTVRLPVAKNTERLQEVFGAFILGHEPDVQLLFKQKPSWATGWVLGFFRVMYALCFCLTVGVGIGVLRHFHFNVVSIFFFLFFLSLVTYFGIKNRQSRLELIMIETGGGVIGAIIDMIFLPFIRFGRWMATRIPRINVLLFFFDVIVEAPFKAVVQLVEGWMAFLREKKDEL